MPRAAIRDGRSIWAWAALGLAGSIATALAGPGMAGGPVRWWYGGGGGVGLFYAGIVALGVGWLAVGRLAPSVRQVWTIAALWSAPLLVGPPLFSHDAYSYLAQGALVHLGLDPYRDTPAVLAQHGQAHVLGAVSPFWRNTTAPYGPLFLLIVSWFSGASLVMGVLLIRLLDLAGLVLLAVYVPRLAHGLGADPARASWLVLLSPLVLLQLVAAAHNDLLMIGLVVAGIALVAIERRVLVGISLCALAAMIKLPAAAAIPFLLVAYVDRKTVWRAVLVAVAVVLVVSVVSGLGLEWISTSVFSTPGKVRLAITPATALGWTVAQIVPVGARGLESALGVAAFVATLLLGVAQLWRARRDNAVRLLGVWLIAVALAGPAAWPWYLTWGLVLLATCPETQFSRGALAVSVAGALVVKADGVLAFPLHTAPVFVVLYLALALALWLDRRRPVADGRRWRPRALVES